MTSSNFFIELNFHIQLILILQLVMATKEASVKRYFELVLGYYVPVFLCGSKNLLCELYFQIWSNTFPSLLNKISLSIKIKNTMTTLNQDLLKKAYDAFNAREIDAVLLLMQPDIHWPNGWEGGYVNGHDQVRDYWTRQWKEIDPHVEPLSFKERADGRIEVEVHQIAKDLQGNLLSDGMVKHIYTIEDNLIKGMEIIKA
jgi:hypothetical protein